MAIPNWLHLSSDSGSGDTIITVTADTNPSTTLRSYDMVLSGRTKSYVVHVIQSDIVVSDNTVNIGPTGGTVVVGYTASTTPTVTVDNTAFTATVSGDTIVISGGTSPSTGQTTGTVTVSAGTSTTTITVAQDGVSFYITPPDTHNIQPAATSDTFTITGNVPWRPVVANGDSWLEVYNTSTRQPNEASVVEYQTPVNWSTTERHGVIAVTWGENFQYRQNIAYVNQDGLPVGSTDYLTFYIATNGTVNWYTFNDDSARVIDYRKNEGNWVTITASPTTQITVSAGDKLEFRGENTWYGNNGFFSGGTAQFTAYGNVMSLIYGDNFIGNTILPDPGISEDIPWGNFSRLFDSSNVVSAEHLILPASSLTHACYYQMFRECHSLITPPALPATTLSTDCYQLMFDGCSGLTSTPELNAPTLSPGCYNGMFRNCTSLTSAPALTATTLATGCYASMFNGCTSLTVAPDLLVSVVPNRDNVHGGASYDGMFNGCSSLTYVKCLATSTTPDFWCNLIQFSEWLEGVPQSGTFVKAAGSNWIPWDGQTPCGYGAQYSGIPDGWTVVEV